jgi:hypothetical protein
VGKAIDNGMKTAFMTPAQLEAHRESQRRLERIRERGEAKSALIVVAVIILPLVLLVLWMINTP